MKTLPTAFILLLLSTLSLASPSKAPGSDEEIEARLRPFGTVCLDTDPTCAVSNTSTTPSSGTRDGKTIYETFCAACHNTGVGNAPVLGSSSDWQPRLNKSGKSGLLTNLKQGVPPLMPAKGACADCSEDELKSVLDYILDKSQ